MDNKKEKEINFKPSNWLYIFLFIYYSVWLIQSFGMVNHYFTFGFDSFLLYDTVEWLCFVLFIIAGIYSFYAVIKTLRGDKDCITSLKWSLVLVFIYTLMNPIRAQIPTYNLLTKYVIFFIRPFFYLVFYLYLCLAKGIKHRFPKEKRKFSPSGWVWLGLWIAFCSVGIYGAWHQFKINQYCNIVDVKTLMLESGEISDGYILFRSDRKWTKWDQPSDTLYIEDRIKTLPTIMSEDSLSKIYIASGKCEKSDARTYNQVLVASLGTLSANINGKFGKMSETSFTDTIVSGKRLMSTLYETYIDSIPVYFEVIMITEYISPKCCVIIRFDKSPIDKNWGIEFTEGLQFDLKKVFKSENNKNNNNTKDNDSNRTSKCNQESYTYIPASLFHSVNPSLFFSVMTLEYHEREITYRKNDYIFKNL